MLRCYLLVTDSARQTAPVTAANMMSSLSSSTKLSMGRGPRGKLASYAISFSSSPAETVRQLETVRPDTGL